MGIIMTKVGVATQSETAPGIWTDEVKEISVRAQYWRDDRRVLNTNTVNDDYTIKNKFSILLSSDIIPVLGQMRYIFFLNNRWKITGVEINHPRAILTTGGLYNGQIPT